MLGKGSLGPWESKRPSPTCLSHGEGSGGNAHLGTTPFSKCVPSWTSSAFSVLELSHQHGFLSTVLYTTFCQNSAAKGQNPATIYCLCELSKGLVGALSQWYPTSSPSFSLSPHPVCSIPTNACLDTDALGLSRSPVFPAPALTMFSFLRAQCSELVIVSRHAPVYLCTPETSWPWARPRDTSVALADFSGSRKWFCHRAKTRGAETAGGAPRPSGRPPTWLISRYASRS